MEDNIENKEECEDPSLPFMQLTPINEQFLSLL